MDVSVLIPTHRRRDKVRRCLAALGQQRTDAEFEILVGVDGGDGAPDQDDIPPGLLDRVRIVRYPKLGYIAVRHRMLNAAEGRLFLSMNDDAYPDQDLIEQHLQSHRAGPRVVSGSSRWLPVEAPTLFDQMVQRTNLLFFTPPTDREPTYRDCYGLNMSAPTDLARQLGGFPDLQDAYGYDDIELAYRLNTQGAAPIILNPDAAVTHDHRYTPTDVLRREYLLGRSAWHYADFNPPFAASLFRRDIRSTAEINHAQAFLERERPDAARIQSRFLRHAHQPPLADSPDAPALLAALADSWTLLKRYLWRQGLVAAARGEPNHWTPLAP